MVVEATWENRLPSKRELYIMDGNPGMFKHGCLLLSAPLGCSFTY
jgi:hypothetical protein